MINRVTHYVKRWSEGVVRALRNDRDRPILELLDLMRPPRRRVYPEGLIDAIRSEAMNGKRPTMILIDQFGRRELPVAGEVTIGLDLSRGPDRAAWFAASPDQARRLSHADLARMMAIPSRVAGAAGDSPKSALLRELAETNALAEEVERIGERVRLRLSLDTSAFARSARRLALRMAALTYRDADRWRPGSGERMLRKRIGVAFAWRQQAFGPEWKEASREYAELQALHRDLYGDFCPRPGSDQEASF